MFNSVTCSPLSCEPKFEFSLIDVTNTPPTPQPTTTCLVFLTL